jgi:hypothetical protein
MPVAKNSLWPERKGVCNMPMILENPGDRMSERDHMAALKFAADPDRFAAAWVRPDKPDFDKAVRSLLA